MRSYPSSHLSTMQSHCSVNLDIMLQIRVQLIVEFATPLLSLYEMHEGNVAGLTKDQMTGERHKFKEVLTQILNKDEMKKCKNNYLLVDYRGTLYIVASIYVGYSSSCMPPYIEIILVFRVVNSRVNRTSLSLILIELLEHGIVCSLSWCEPCGVTLVLGCQLAYIHNITSSKLFKVTRIFRGGHL